MTKPESGHVSLRTYLLVYAVLLLLATGSWLLALVHVPGGVVLAIAIGAIKAVLVFAYFMHLAEEAFSFKLTMIVATILVLIFVGLTAVDPLTRDRNVPERAERILGSASTGRFGAPQIAGPTEAAVQIRVAP